MNNAAAGEAGEAINGGWRVATGFAATVAPEVSRNFYAVYTGDAFGHAERGIIAVMARAHSESDEHVRGAREASQIVVHSLAEGYFGARRTLSARRAASVALNSINRWLAAQTRNENSRHLVPVSLTALMFHNSQIGIAQIGSCLMYRYRNKTLTPLMRDQSRITSGGRLAPTRAVGLDDELPVDYAEEAAAAADRYIVVSGLESQSQEAIYTVLTERLGERLGRAATAPGMFAESLLAALGNASGQDKAAMVLDIIACPAGDAGGSKALADLPLRPAPREGDVWDNFVIGRTLYHGRYTVLKTAYDEIEKREVVLKIPLPSMLQDEVFTAGFMREAWVGTTVRGANVARYIELPPERRSSLYLVLPFYNGETLEARLHRTPPVSLPEGIGIALKLCEAVQDLAAIQIVHRDIKPENIMLLERNELRLLDLGLAYLPGIDMQDSVKPGGTLRYMAPELIRGVQANARSEVYALAVTVYRMFSGGAYPFGQREAVPLMRLRRDLPRWLGKILKQGLAPEPVDRFADAGALAAALQEGLISGAADDAAGSAWLPVLTKVQIWQAVAGFFAIGFFVLLLRVLR